MSVYKRPGSPYYQIAVTMPTTGRVVRKSSGTENKEEAERLEKKWRKDLGLDTTIFDNQSITYRELWGKCVSKWESQKHRSLATYKTHQDRLLAFFGDMPISSIRVHHIEDFRDRFAKTSLRRDYKSKGREVSGATINRALAVFKITMNIAFSSELLERVPPIKSIESEEGRYRFLKHDEKKLLLDTLQGLHPEVHAMAQVAVRTGMRRGELYRLRVEHILFDKKIIVVKSTKTPDKSLMTKSGKTRYLPLFPSIESLLRGLCANKRPEETLFGSIPEFTLRWYFEKAVDLCGIKDFRFHDLRHTFASDMVGAKVSLQTLRELMGHSSIAITEGYAHFDPDKYLPEVAKIEDHLVKCEENTSQKEVAVL